MRLHRCRCRGVGGRSGGHRGSRAGWNSGHGGHRGSRGGWNSGFHSCAHWLSWRVGLDLGAARERVRVARAIGTLPRLSEAFARGELSYAKVRALTRVATPDCETALLEFASAATAAQTERFCRAWRRVDDENGDPEHERRPEDGL